MTSTATAPSPDAALWRADLGALLRLTGPVAAARLGVMAMGLTDAIVVGRYSAEQLGYQALAWTLPGTAMVGAMGFLSGVQVMTARYIGEGKPGLTGGVLRRGLAYALMLGLVMGGLLFAFGPLMLNAFHLAPGLAEGAAPALRLFALSLPAVLIGTCAGLYLEAIGRPSVSMAAMWAANAVNLAVDLVLVPGRFGLPALGAAGAAWGTFSARAFLAVALVGFAFRMKAARELGLYVPASDGPIAAREQRRLGYGAGTSQLVEAAAFSGMNVVAGWVSAFTVAGWAVTVNLVSIVFMIPLGMATATSVLVGHAYGARDPAGVRRAAILAALVGGIYGCVVGVLTVVFRVQIASTYTHDAVLIAEAAGGLVLAASFLPPDAVQVVTAQALRARGDVLMPAVTHIASYAVVMIPLAWLLGVKLHGGLTGIMGAVVIASFLSAALLLWRFWRLSRRD
jgi:MATE family multidrug resistance protein